MPDVGELAEINIRVVTPGNEADLIERMARNDARGLPEAVYPRTCIIVGSGPSARSEALWERLKANSLADCPITTVACNGAYKLFAKHNLTPTYWTCCDPQDLVLDFIPDHPNPATIYLVATKCPDALFDRLQIAGCDVRAWRLDDIGEPNGKFRIPTSVSITIVTQTLMRMMGYHRFEVYGWDCCYLDGEHHADPDSVEHYQLFDLHLRDEATGEICYTFQTAGPWMAELQDAAIQAHNLKGTGYELIVHGPGAVATLLRAKGLIE